MKVSVIVTNYNYASYLRECIQSVIDQTYQNLEIIIVDDGSTDNSEVIIDSIDDDRIIKVYRDNGGQAAAFNSGFEKVTGDYVAFIDADDRWYANKIETCLKIVKKFDVVLVQHYMDVISKDGKLLDFLHPARFEEGIINVMSKYYELNKVTFYAPTSGLFMRKEILENYFPLDISWKICADIALTTPIPIFGSVYNLSNILGSYRIHDSNGWWGSKEQQKVEKNKEKYIEYTNNWLVKYNYPKLNCIETRYNKKQLNMQGTFSELQLIDFYFNEMENGVLIDVGGHEGGVTSAFAKKGWMVLAFEPEENNRKLFLTNHTTNPNVICIPKAVTDRSGDKIPFYTSDTHYGIHSIKPFHDTHHVASYEVETITLKDALEESEVEHVSFLKVDTEGADFLALKGFDWNRISPELVMVEFMDDRSLKNFNYTHHDMAGFMKEKGYSCFVSEWGAIKAYGIKGQAGEPHKWFRCVPYPLDHEPAWGNLIFVPELAKDKFNITLKKYLKSLKNYKSGKPKKDFILKTKIFIKKTFFN